MKTIYYRRHWSLLVLALGAALWAASPCLAQQSNGAGQQSQEANGPQPGPQQDPIAQLNLTPQQRQQIRTIREQNKDERAAINQRLRETQIALDLALDSESPNESLIEQRAREAGEAQAASIRLRALTEARIRRVLTPEQLKTLRILRAQAQQLRKEQRMENVRERNLNGRPLPNQRNGILPGPGARRDNLLRKPRP